VPAPDLEHPVIRPQVQLLDDRTEALAHDATTLAGPESLARNSARSDARESHLNPTDAVSVSRPAGTA
jgi:hypothetical protein